MVYETFINEIRDIMQQILGDGYHLTLRKITKNNGICLDGLCINEKGRRIAPTIYLNPYYKEMSLGRNLQEIAGEILDVYEQNRTLPQFPFEKMTSFDHLKDRIACKLVHRKANTEFLKDVPNIPYLDLAIIFYIYIADSDNGQMTSVIHNDHIKSWNITTHMLYKTALDNTERMFPLKLESMEEVLTDILHADFPDRETDELIKELSTAESMSDPLYMMTNSCGINGACCILYHNALKHFSDMRRQDFYVLPSSIHEVLLLPFEHEDDVSVPSLKSMVSDINENEVPTEDRLSGEIYRYNRKTGLLSIC